MIKQADESYEAPQLEARVRALWDARDAYAATKAHRADGERYFFVDGPPYTTGEVHVGTARNKVIKDTVLRWLRMRGYRVWDQPGYDMHGLPIEVLVERTLGVRNKMEIETEVGVAEFVETCRRFARERLEAMTADFAFMGVWMDWDRPYMTITNDYIESAWWTFHRAHARGLLTQAQRSLEWCPRCETPLAGYEIEFWDETDPSIFVAFPLADREGSLLIWTTTPWTLPANLAVAVHPEFTYARVRFPQGEREAVVWIAEANAAEVLEAAGVSDYTVEETLPGTALEGWAYRHPLEEEVPLQQELGGERVHTVLLSDTVTTEFTGLVHIAPGHGPEDFALGQAYGIDPLSPVDERGRFTEEAGKYAGTPTHEANAILLSDLERHGALLHRDEIVHRYGHCWRCDTPILYRTTDQWFIRVTEVKETMLEEVRRVDWTPDWAGSARQYDWVENAKDWTVSRQRYWGIPIPIWACGNGHRRVVASVAELREAEGYEDGMDLHRPWIDAVILPCEECGEPMERVPDVLDVWFDSAIASWASLGYPRQSETFDAWWPARWIVEAHDQTRGWFYSQLGAGVVAFDRCPYDSVLMHGWVWPPEGEAYSKSRGGALTPGDVAEEFGMDAFRLYELKGAPPWDDFAFHMDEVRNAHRTLNILWNVHRFATLYMTLDAFEPTEHEWGELGNEAAPEDRWVMSRLQGLVAEVAAHLGGYELHRAARALEEFVVQDLSRWYVRLVRDRTWEEEGSPRKRAAYRALYDVLLTLSRLLAPFCPFITEAMYQDLSEVHPTVHMEDWPTPISAVRDETLEDQMDATRAFVEEVGRLRQSQNYKLRWPVARCLVLPADEEARKGLKRLQSTFCAQANAKVLDVLAPGETIEERELALQPNRAAIGRRYKSWLPDIVAALERSRPEEVHQAVSRGSYEISVQGQPVQITNEMVAFEEALPEGLVEGATPYGTVVVDFRQTPEIVAESYARELVRRIQQMRKEMDLPVDARIETAVSCSPRLREHFEAWEDYVARETRSRILRLGVDAPAGDRVQAWPLDEDEEVVIGVRRT